MIALNIEFIGYKNYINSEIYDWTPRRIFKINRRAVRYIRKQLDEQQNLLGRFTKNNLASSATKKKSLNLGGTRNKNSFFHDGIKLELKTREKGDKIKYMEKILSK